MRSNLLAHGLAAAVLAGAVLTSGLVASPASAAIQAGTLRCNIAPGYGAVIGSQKAVDCTFTPSIPGHVEMYKGLLTRVGLDISQTNAGVLTYAVIEASNSFVPFSLSGGYVGAGAGITLGQGLGVDALVGGNGNHVALQPVAVSNTSGIGLNAGVGSLTLEPVPMEPRMRVHHHHHHHHA